MKLSLLLSSLLIFTSFSVWSASLSGDIKTDNKKTVRDISAEYQVKTSFFALPIKAKIEVERLEPGIYVASVRLKSPFLKVVQKEKAHIEQCKLELLQIDSRGNRVGAKPWDEKVDVSWPDRTVKYQDGGKVFPEYHSDLVPTGFVSLFAHQYLSYFKKEPKKALTYTQSKKGWRIDYQSLGLEKDFDSHSRYFKRPVDATRFIIPRQDMKQTDMPSVWYVPETLGAFPLLMTMKLGFFHVEVRLKSLSVEEPQVQQFFKDWAC